MADYTTEKIRNITLIGHGSNGKTTLTEAMLFAAGHVDRQGKVEDGAATTDYDPEEIKRHISISAAIAPVEWKGTKINVVDVPGYFDFIGEMMGPLRVVETAGIVVGAVGGLDVGAEKAWDYSKKNNVCRMFIINRMDAENANYMKVVEQLRDKFGSSVVPLLLPIGAGPAFKGVVNVLENKAYEGTGKGLKEVAVPGDMASTISTAMEEITEAAAGADDELMMKYLEGEELTHDEILSGFRAGMQNGTIVPVVAVSALTGVGVAKMLDVMSVYLHSPKGAKAEGENPKTGAKEERACDNGAPFSAFVYKTVADPFVGSNNTFESNGHNFIDALCRDIKMEQHTTLKAMPIPYYMERGLWIEGGFKLTIEPGTQMYFKSEQNVNMQDAVTLIADGTADKPIIFRGMEDENSYWQGIKYHSTKEASVMNHCQILNCGEDDAYFQGGCLCIYDDSRLTLTNCTIGKSLYYGITLDGVELFDRITHSNNTFVNCGHGNVWLESGGEYNGVQYESGQILEDLP